MVQFNFTIVILFLWSSIAIGQQDVEVRGQLKLGQLDVISSGEFVLTRQCNGKIRVVSPQHLQPEYPQPLPLNSSWVNYGNGYQEASFYKFEDKVYLDGLIQKSSGTISVGDTLFVLPKYYKPNQRIIVHGKFESQRVRLNIEVDGAVVIIAGPETTTWISLDGIWFYRSIGIGSYHKGGIVFYIADPPVDLNGDGLIDRGLVAAEEDLADAEFGCYGTNIPGAAGTVIGSGSQNTAEFIQGCTENNIATRLCTDFAQYGYHDWFLPSINELFELNNAIGFNAEGENYNIGGFTFGTYWSSSESGFNGAWGEGLWTDSTFNFSKTANLNVRPIRVFK